MRDDRPPARFEDAARFRDRAACVASGMQYAV
jgi:hypothetical protein